MNVRAVFQYGFYSGVSGRLIWEQKEAYVSQAGATLPQMLSAWRNFTANTQCVTRVARWAQRPGRRKVPTL